MYEGSTVPDESEIYFTNLSGMRENMAFVWFMKSFTTTEKENDEIAVGWIEEGNPALLIKRYLAYNTMHLLHDEILPSLATILHHKNLRESVSERMIVSLDDVGPNPNDMMMTWLGQFWRINNLQATLRYRNSLKPNQTLDYICFKEAYVGLDSPSTSWYHYGFERAQGPIKNISKDVVGGNVRSAVEWIKDELFYDSERKKLVESDVKELFEMLKKSTLKSLKTRAKILIASRTQTRLILNEEELMEKLKSAFPSAQIEFIRQETMELEALIMEISESIVLIGMHGALLALSAFLPPGALLIEMFPFGVPAENYTPYKTLSNLPKMNIKYITWTNSREDPPFNVGHPGRHFTSGGLIHFPASYQEGIKSSKTVPNHKCCYSPFWLYRIFQDTNVDSDAIIHIIKGNI